MFFAVYVFVSASLCRATGYEWEYIILLFAPEPVWFVLLQQVYRQANERNFQVCFQL